MTGETRVSPAYSSTSSSSEENIGKKSRTQNYCSLVSLRHSVDHNPLACRFTISCLRSPAIRPARATHLGHVGGLWMNEIKSKRLIGNWRKDLLHFLLRIRLFKKISNGIFLQGGSREGLDVSCMLLKLISFIRKGKPLVFSYVYTYLLVIVIVYVLVVSWMLSKPACLLRHRPIESWVRRNTVNRALFSADRCTFFSRPLNRFH